MVFKVHFGHLSIFHTQIERERACNYSVFIYLFFVLQCAVSVYAI